jgi:hypothetical protein
LLLLQRLFEVLVVCCQALDNLARSSQLDII